MSEKKTYVFGHQNPDTDSICSALAYANLKNAIGETDVVPKRLGPVSKETQFALDYFGVEPPEILQSVEPQISDLTLAEIPHVYEDDAVITTLETIANTPGRSTPVVDENNKLLGVVSLPDLIDAFTKSYEPEMLKDAKTPYKNILDIVDGEVIQGELPERVTGNVYVHSQLMPGQKVGPDDLLISSRTDFDAPMAFATGAGTILVSNVEEGQTVRVPKNFKGNVITTSKTPFETIRLMWQVVPIREKVVRDKVEYFVDYETLEDVRQNMLSSPHSRFPVVNEDGEVLGSISKSSLVDFNKKKVILVDHNERSQSIAGIEEAEIAEVIDHHRINEITTSMPLFMRLEPVGCTSTIVKELYDEKGVEIPKQMAGLMLSAILSDTLVFNSPTCTPRDVKAAEDLAKIAGVNPREYGRELLVAGSDISDKSPQEILSQDRKRFTMGDYKVTIAQVNTGDYKGMFKHLDALMKAMDEYNEEYQQDLFVLMITDIVLGGSEIVFTGNASGLAREAFDIPTEEFSKYIPGIFSRKKQVVPPLMNASATIDEQKK